MYDFCLTFPYAALLGLGGLIGFLTKGSLPSLVGGVGSATVLGIAAQISLNYYHQAGTVADIYPFIAPSLHSSCAESSFETALLLSCQIQTHL
jgi:hypothetical protein